MTKANKAPATQPTIVLKSVLDAIHKANPNSTLTAKKMRATLRQKMRDVHVANASWIFTQQQADQCRALFDPAFAARIAKQRKATTRKPKVVKEIKAPEVADA